MKQKSFLNPIFTLCLFVGVLTLGNGCSHSSSRSSAASYYTGTIPFYGQEQIERYQLKNGLKILILKDESSKTFAYQTWYNVGSRDESVGLTGLAHLFEHMMFKATKNHAKGEFDFLMESAGADGKNAFTSQDYTGYVQNLPSDQFELVASLEADRMTNLIVDDDTLNREREVVKNERRFRTENSPDGAMFEKLYEMAFTKHPYRWPVIGYEEDLNRADAAQCRAFYGRFYSPDNAAIVIVGNVDSAFAVNTIQKYYGSFPMQHPVRYSGPKEAPQREERRTSIKIATEFPKVLLGYHIPDVNHEDMPVLDVLSYLLGQTNSSALYRSLVDDGLASGVGSFAQGHKDNGLFLITANLLKGVDSARAVRVIDQTLASLPKKNLVEELELARSQYEFELYRDLISNPGKARNIGFFESVASSASRGQAIVAAAMKVTPSDIVRVLNRYFLPENRTIILGLPK